MGKVTKRARKFNAKGGVKAALDKGTVTKKGKLRKRSPKPHSDRPRASNSKPREDEDVLDQGDDFSGKGNLGDLNIDDFFEHSGLFQIRTRYVTPAVAKRYGVPLGVVFP